MQRSNPDAIRLHEVLITEELSRRAYRIPNMQAENRAMRTLIQQMAHHSDALLQTLVDVALELCNAGTTGVSLLETTADGATIFRWVVLAGALAHQVGGSTPRDFSPCGVCLDQGAPVLFSHPEHYFTYLQRANTPIVEGLVLPLVSDRHVFGTIWVMSHDEQRRFDSEDVRIMTSLADVAATALLLRQRQTKELLAANAVLETEIVERKQVEAQTHALIANLPGGAVFVVDRDLRYLLAEGEALSAAGFTSKDFIGRTIFEVLPPDLAASYEPMYRQALAGEPFEHEHHAHNHIYLSRGTPLRTAPSAEAELPPDGEIYAVLAVSYDITDRKTAEIALRESEARLQSIANLVPDLLWDSEPDGSTNWYNQRWLEYTGQTFEQAINWGWTDAIHPEDQEGSARRYREAVEQGIPLRQEHRIRRHDGVYHWFVVKALPLKDKSGKVIKMYGAATDIHEQRVALEALRESEEKYRSLFETMDEGYLLSEVIFDKNGKPIDILFLEANPAAVSLAGRDFSGQRMREIDPNYEEYWYEIYGRVALTGESVRAEQYAEPHDRWFDFYAFKVGGQESRRVAAVFNDITDRKRHDTNLAFLAEVSHDLARLTSIDETMNALGEKIGRYFNLSACVFAELSETAEIAVINHTWQLSHMPSFIGTYRMQDFVAPEVLQLCRAGEAVVIHDVFKDPRVDGEQYAALNIGSFLSIPLVRDSEWRFLLVIYHTEPHNWRDDEIELTHELANRIWTRLERARAEAALVTSEVKYRTLFESIDQGYCLIEVILNEAGKPIDLLHLEVNQAYQRQTGLSDMVGKRALEISPNGEEWFDFYGNVARTGEPARIEYLVEALGRWFTVYASRVGGEGSLWVAVVFEDITDRKRAEQTLRESEARQAFLLQMSDALRAEPDADAVANRALQMLSEQMQLDRCYIGVYRLADDRGDFTHQVGNDRVPPLPNEVRLSDFPDALRVAFDRTLVIDNVSETEGLTDTDRQNLSALGLCALVAATLRKGENNPLWSIVAVSGSPRHWTRGEVALLEEITERTWFAIERTRAEAALRDAELQRMREQAAREQERQRAESLAELDRAKTLFFSNISHEFRTPLTLLLAPLQDILSDRTLDPVHRERLELAHRNSLRLLKLVNTLLDFSRIEAGRTEAVYEPTDLASFTAELCSVFRAAIEQAGLRLIVDCPPLPEPVYVDREMWEKIVLNFLSNALKFTLEGEITVSLRAEPSSEPQASASTLHGLISDQQSSTSNLEPSTSNPSLSTSELETSGSELETQNSKLKTPQRVILQIHDTGTGIAPEHLPHLFERFYQVRNTQARTHEGSGIGLALVHELVKLHGGTIQVRSTVGEGTRFAIALPFGTAHLPPERIQATPTLTATALSANSYVEAAAQWLPAERFDPPLLEPVAQQANPEPLPASPKLLLVDDNADMRNYLTRILSDRAEVTTVADGAAALASVQRQRPDLILTDVMMPGLSGFELLQILRADPDTREIPIILLSARAGEEAIVEGLEAGASDYLIKPFSAQELMSRVSAHLQMASLRNAALSEARTTLHRQDEWLSAISHELNTPLISILGWARLLRANPSDSAILTRALNTIERNAVVQGKLVRDLLDISRITSDKLWLDLHPVELLPVLETAIATVNHLAEAKGVELLWRGMVGSISPTEAVVMGDRDRLQQVVCNLLVNAIKFTPTGGRVEMMLAEETDSTQQEPENEASSAAPSSAARHIQLIVTDTGIGITPEFLPHVFERFRQARISDSEKGLGLGLAIAQHIVKQHRGTIQAQSSGPGKGTTFTVRLPLA